MEQCENITFIKLLDVTNHLRSDDTIHLHIYLCFSDFRHRQDINY